MMNTLICYYQVAHLRRLFDAVLLALSLNVLPPLHFGTQKTLVPPPLQISKNVHVPTQKGFPPPPQRKFFQSLVEKFVTSPSGCPMYVPINLSPLRY